MSRKLAWLESKHQLPNRLAGHEEDVGGLDAQVEDEEDADENADQERVGNFGEGDGALFGEIHFDDGAQVIIGGDGAVEDSDHDQSVQAGFDRAGEQIKLSDKSDRRGKTCHGEKKDRQARGHDRMLAGQAG